jgi:RNA:NAD 2'-phosphotransferase (TPT1/KptA family)
MMTALPATIKPETVTHEPPVLSMARHECRGKPVILKVEAGRMHRDGHTFYLSLNGVWLTDAVPPDYLSRT